MKSEKTLTLLLASSFVLLTLFFVIVFNANSKKEPQSNTPSSLKTQKSRKEEVKEITRISRTPTVTKHVTYHDDLLSTSQTYLAPGSYSVDAFIQKTRLKQYLISIPFPIKEAQHKFKSLYAYVIQHIKDVRVMKSAYLAGRSAFIDPNTDMIYFNVHVLSAKTSRLQILTILAQQIVHHYDQRHISHKGVVLSAIRENLVPIYVLKYLFSNYNLPVSPQEKKIWGKIYFYGSYPVTIGLGLLSENLASLFTEFFSDEALKNRDVSQIPQIYPLFNNRGQFVALPPFMSLKKFYETHIQLYIAKYGRISGCIPWETIVNKSVLDDMPTKEKIRFLEIQLYAAGLDLPSCYSDEIRKQWNSHSQKQIKLIKNIDRASIRKKAYSLMPAFFKELFNTEYSGAYTKP